MRKLARFLKHYKKQLIIGPIFKLTEAVFELIVPVVMASIIDIGVKNGDAAYVYRMGGVMLLLGFTGLVCAFICQRCAAVASQGFGTELRSALFAHINTFSYAELDRFGTSSLITRITNDVNQLQFAVAMLIRLVIRAPFLVLGSIVASMILDWRLSLIFLAVTPLIVVILWLIMRKTVPLYRAVQKKLDAVSLLSRENLQGARVIRAFSKQEEENGRFETASDQLAATSERVGRLSALLNPATFAVMNLGVVAVVWFGGIRVEGGTLTQGQIIAFVNYLNQMLLALIVVANLVVTFTKAFASAGRVTEVFETMPSVVDAAEKTPAPLPGAPAIELRNVSFGYEGGEYALKNINLTIERGQTVGIIGATGSGKSTLINLLPRFYDPQEGRVLIEGVDARAYPLAALREKFGLVPQAAVLFSGTIAQNLRWGRPGATLTEMEDALRLAQAWEFVEKLPDGLEHRIVQGAKNLSGGQKQRLTIARAFVGRPPIVILDDSASALDFATDAALRRAIRRESNGMTVLLVSQRVSTIKRADQIVVLEDGMVAGIGTHEELFAQCEEYREICLSQLSEKEAAQ